MQCTGMSEDFKASLKFRPHKERKIRVKCIFVMGSEVSSFCIEVQTVLSKLFNLRSSTLMHFL